MAGVVLLMFLTVVILPKSATIEALRCDWRSPVWRLRCGASAMHNQCAHSPHSLHAWPRGCDVMRRFVQVTHNTQHTACMHGLAVASTRNQTAYAHVHARRELKAGLKLLTELNTLVWTSKAEATAALKAAAAKAREEEAAAAAAAAGDDTAASADGGGGGGRTGSGSLRRLQGVGAAAMLGALFGRASGGSRGAGGGYERLPDGDEEAGLPAAGTAAAAGGAGAGGGAGGRPPQIGRAHV